MSCVGPQTLPDAAHVYIHGPQPGAHEFSVNMQQSALACRPTARRPLSFLFASKRVLVDVKNIIFNPGTKDWYLLPRKARAPLLPPQQLFWLTYHRNQCLPGEIFCSVCRQNLAGTPLNIPLLGGWGGTFSAIPLFPPLSFSVTAHRLSTTSWPFPFLAESPCRTLSTQSYCHNLF